ncbi:MAG: ribonuclease HI [Thermoplasmata archaeon]
METTGTEDWRFPRTRPPGIAPGGPAEEGPGRGGAAFAHFDGACRPPRGGGVATFGFIVEAPGHRHEACGLAAPPWTPESTNNVAEYVAAIRALEWLRGRGFAGPAVLLGDSQLVIRQMRGEYRVRADHLKPYHERLGELARGFAEIDFRWIPREQNRRADELSKIALESTWTAALAERPAARSRPGRWLGHPAGPRRPGRLIP